MRSLWRNWQRRAHRAVLRQLRTPPRDDAISTIDDHAVTTRMPVLSSLYGRIVTAKRTRALAHAQRISPTNVPVISVGNFTFGATGKTPCVMFLADEILRYAALEATTYEGKTRVPMLLTRGYGDDEWRMFAARFPSCKVAVGADRLALGKQRVAHYGHQLSCVLLEDGLQQWTIQKDLEVVMVDALAPFGNGKLLPHGSLRESPADALARADIVLLHHANLVQDATRLRQLLMTIQQWTPRDRETIVGTSEMAVVALPTLANYVNKAPTLDDPVGNLDSSPHAWERFRGKTALVFCGVGNPESVERVVRAMGCWAHVAIESFPDHHAFSADDLHDVRTRVAALSSDRGSDVVLITTEKDIARSAALVEKSLGDGVAVHVLVAAFRLRSEADRVRNRVKNVLRL